MPFPELVSWLLRELGLEMPPGAAQEVYTLHFADEPDVHMVRRTSSRCIDVVTTAAELPSLKTPEILSALLELNARDETSFTPTVMLDLPTRSVLVKVRLPESAVDIALLRKMLDGVRQQSAAVRKLTVAASARPVQAEPKKRLSGARRLVSSTL